MPIRAVIFDYDGLLVDTEDLWFQACQRVCAPFGMRVTEEHRLELMRSGLSAYMIERFNLPVTYDVLRSQLYTAFDQLTATGLKLMPGAHSAIELAAAHYPLAIGSGSITPQIEAGLTSLGLRSYFQVIVGSNLSLRSKPEPDIYLEAARLLGQRPEQCLVLEDNPKGVMAAKAAGMLCIAVPNRFLPGADYSQADAVVPSLDQIGNHIIGDKALS